jgi:CRP-like cAMP-binding protein
MKPHSIPIPRWISPSYYTITFSEALGHMSFILVALSYYAEDFVELRIMAVAGSTCMLFFTFFHPHGRILWLPFKWNLLFTAINLQRIGVVYWERFLADRLPQRLLDVRDRHFYLVDPADFAKLANKAKIESFQEGDVLITQGDKNRYVRLVLDGRFKVYRDDKFTYLLEEANFISEVALHAGLFLPGTVESCCTVVADMPSTVMTWERSQLIDLMQHHAGLRRSLKAIFSWDLVRKLKTQRGLLAAGMIDDPEEWTKVRNEQTKHRYFAILQNFLSNEIVENRKAELNKYRLIHCISDETHELALQQCGWTPEQFERGYREQPLDMSYGFAKKMYRLIFAPDVDPDQQAGA